MARTDRESFLSRMGRANIHRIQWTALLDIRIKSRVVPTTVVPSSFAADCEATKRRIAVIGVEIGSLLIF